MINQRFFDGPFTVPTPAGPADPPPDLLDALPSLARVLATPEPYIPALRDWSYRCDESLQVWGGRFSHWVEWTAPDTALVESALDDHVSQFVECLIHRWTWIWPDVAAEELPLRNPTFMKHLLEAYSSDSRYRRKRDAFQKAWLDTALHEGLFESFRGRRGWPSPVAQKCRVCGRPFAPETLSHWMRQYGPPRYCASCCCRVRQGYLAVTPSDVRTAIRDATEALGFVPAQDLPAKADLGVYEVLERDRAMAALVCLPNVSSASEALGVTRKTARWLAILQDAGVVGEAWRPARGTMCVAHDGHSCRSLGERNVDDFLTRCGLEHEPEPRWPLHALLNPNGTLRADWRLRDGTFVEYVGLMTDEEYRARIERKRRLAEECEIRLLILQPEDLSRLREVFAPWLPTLTGQMKVYT